MNNIVNREIGHFYEDHTPSKAKQLAVSIVGMAAIVAGAWMAFYFVAVFQCAIK